MLKRFYRAVLLCCILFPAMAGAQSASPFVFNIAGGSYDNPASYFRFEWSIGELTLIDAFAPPDSSVLVTQGVLQPCTDKVGSSPYILYFEPGEYKLFPNPTTGKFELDFFVRQTGRMEVDLIDATGRLLTKRSFRYDGCCRIEHFDLTRYPNGTYFVVATLTPDGRRPGDNMKVIRHSGIRVVKISPTY